MTGGQRASEGQLPLNPVPAAQALISRVRRRSSHSSRHSRSAGGAAMMGSAMHGENDDDDDVLLEAIKSERGQAGADCQHQQQQHAADSSQHWQPQFYGKHRLQSQAGCLQTAAQG